MERKLKLALFLMITYCTSVKSSDEKSKEESLETAAAAQLDRLAPFRKENQLPENFPDNFKDLFRYYANKTNREASRTREKFEELRFPLQLLKLLGNTQIKGSELEVKRRGDALEANSNHFQDSSYDALMQERIRRSGSNSGSFVSGIATNIIGGVVRASSGASRGSSSSSSGLSTSSDSHPNSYGPPVYSYGQQSFDIWDFKKAILNTVFQALKAISGGVLALKGQLIKGGGFLVSTKGKIISSTGEAISSLGRNIASSTYVVAPKPAYSHSGYAYNPPPTSHDESYDGPPPSANDYTSNGFEDSYHPQNSFGAASDDDVQAGLVIMTPTDSDHHQEDHHQDLDPRHPNIKGLEDSFGGPQKGSNMGNILKGISGDSSLKGQFSPQELQEFQLPSTKSPPPFTALNHQNFLSDNKNLEYYPIPDNQNDGYHVEIPKIAPLPISESNPSNSLHIDYPPNNFVQNVDQLHVSGHTNIFEPMKFQNENHPFFKNGIHGLELPKLTTLDQHNLQEQFSSSQVAGIKGSLLSGSPIRFGQEPLKIPILNELPKEHRQHFKQIGNGPFHLKTFEPFNTKQFGDAIFGGKIIHQGFEIQPSVGYSLKDSGLHRT
ncbi:uncharacterized protein LOC117170216 [Belonocnema kinseyi]|uniref:uncharacterized protein LOC117170216 n=1 Tax=Belonocnema kinseyi TaxID=2817044 RepID=UPI00143DF719|nr:uncharacterized protein LOC117170216 [Belonocnema kinseyi]